TKVMLLLKRVLFRRMPNLGIKFAKLSSPSRLIELEAVEAIVPRARGAIDIGASWGLYTILLRRCTDSVVAFEPNPMKAEYLTDLCRDTNVAVHAVALSDQSGEADLIIPNSASAFATIEAQNPLSAISTSRVTRVHVPCRPLDNFRLKNVGFIK